MKNRRTRNSSGERRTAAVAARFRDRRRAPLRARLSLLCRFAAPLFSCLPLPTLLLLLLLLSPPSAAAAAAAVPPAGNWTKQRSGTLAWLRAVYFLDQERGWAVGGNGTLLVTTDGGGTWRLHPTPAKDTMRDVYFSDAETGWIVCERSIYELKTKEEPRSYLLKTTNGGATWRRVQAAGEDIEVVLVRVVFADREHGWVFGEEGALYSTRDGGESWLRQRAPTRHLLLGGMFLDAQQGWLVGTGQTLLQTADGGATWTAGRIEPNRHDNNNSSSSGGGGAARLRAVSFIDDRRGWAVGSGGRVLATTNGGRSWRALDAQTDADLADVKFFDAAEGWAVGGGGTVIHTTDGGARWRVEPHVTPHALERLCFVNPARGWAVGFGGTIIAYTPGRTPVVPPRQPPALKST